MVLLCLRPGSFSNLCHPFWLAADNSCLFNAIGYVMHGSKTKASFLRWVRNGERIHMQRLGVRNLDSTGPNAHAGALSKPVIVWRTRPENCTLWRFEESIWAVHMHQLVGILSVCCRHSRTWALASAPPSGMDLPSHFHRCIVPVPWDAYVWGAAVSIDDLNLCPGMRMYEIQPVFWSWSPFHMEEAQHCSLLHCHQHIGSAWECLTGESSIRPHLRFACPC